MQMCDGGKGREGGNTQAGGNGGGKVEMCASNHGEKHGGLVRKQKGNVDGGGELEV